MKIKQILDDTQGSSLVEFTITLPLFLLLTFGLLQAGLLLFTWMGLQHGVEVAARCASVNYSAKQLGLSNSCFTVGGTPTPSQVYSQSSPYNYIRNYAQQNSWGINAATASLNNFTVLTPNGSPPGTCGTDLNNNPLPGYVVAVTYQYSAMRYLFNPTLRAQSCFPINIS
jgi:Flp pilus assembly protein TadG